MSEPRIRFEDGAAYEQIMGVWSRLAGELFLDWLAPALRCRWIDVGCGSGAFTQLLIDRCAPAEVHGIDPSPAQLAFARTRPGASIAQFHEGSATALPFPDGSFDVAVMALVIFFVPDPAKGVAEMARVVAPGGTVGAYAWDLAGGGLPAEPIHAEMRVMGVNPPWPPRAEASRLGALRELWTVAGLTAVETREITVARTFADFDELWATNLMGPNVGPLVADMSAADAERLKSGVRARLPADAGGRITYTARANAVQGRVPN